MSFSKESQTSRPVEGHFLPRRPRPHRTLSSLRYDGDEVPVLIRLSELSWQPPQHHQASGVSSAVPAAANPLGPQPAGYVVPAAPRSDNFGSGLATDDRRTHPSLTPDQTVPGPMLTAASSGSIPTASAASSIRSNVSHGYPFMTVPGPPPGASPFAPSMLSPQAAAASGGPFQEAAPVAYPAAANYAPGPAYAMGPAYAAVHPANPGSGPGALAGQFGPTPLAGGPLPGAERMLPVGHAGIGLVPAGVHPQSPTMPDGWQAANLAGVSAARVSGALGPAYPPVLSQDPSAVGVLAGSDLKSAAPHPAASQPAAPLGSWVGPGSPLASVLPMTPGAPLGGGVLPLLGPTSPASLADVYREAAGQGGMQPNQRAAAGSPVGQAMEQSLPSASPHSPTLFTHAHLAAASPPGATPQASSSNPVLPPRGTGINTTVGRDALMPNSSERPGIQTQPVLLGSAPGGSEAGTSGVLASSPSETTTTQPAAVKAGNYSAAENRPSGASKAEAPASATKFTTTQGTSLPGATASSVSSAGLVSSTGAGSRVAAEAEQTVSVQPEDGETKSHSAHYRDNTGRRQRKQDSRKAERPAESHAPTSSTDSGKTGASLLGEWDRSKTALALLLAFVSGFAFWTLQGRIFRGGSRQDAASQTAAATPAAATGLRTTQELGTELGPSEQHSPAHAFAPAGRDDRTLSSGMTQRSGHLSGPDSPAATFPRLRSVQLLDESRVESPPRVRFAKPDVKREESATGWPEEEPGAADHRSLRSQDESSSGGAGGYIIEAASSQDDAVQGWPDEPVTPGENRSTAPSPWETEPDRSSASEGGRSQETFRTSRLETEPVRGDTRSGAEVQDGSGLQGTIEIPRARASQERHGSHLY